MELSWKPTTRSGNDCWCVSMSVQVLLGLGSCYGFVASFWDLANVSAQTLCIREERTLGLQIGG